ncbi:type II secretion system F family protein [Massilia sp. 9096]|uniref:type II secretion system F family protein n=1 Tax=Massilia sp. 9096 TaxID=1500894 RepID=UPI000567A1A0|nr:type II secretion system F family protein [Massilia sp. 9096]
MPIELDVSSDAATGARAGGPVRAGARLTLGERAPGVRERMLFTERLALLLDTGVPLHTGLQSLLEQMKPNEQPRLRAMIAAMADDILAGERFSHALGRHPLFPPTYVNLVAAGEAGGFLPDVLTQLVDMDEKEDRLRRTVVSALSYPLFLLAFSVIVVLFILIWVFPKFAVMFEQIRDQLPITTRILLSISTSLTQHGTLVGAGAAALVVLGWVLARRPDVRAALDRATLRVPVLRDIFAQIYLTRLLRVMGMSLERGVTILATLEACRGIVRNADVQRFILELETDVTEGKGIAAGFQKSPFVPPSVRQMVATGEATGTLGRVMGRVADSFDRDLTKKLNQLSKLAEPVMLMVMGAMVGTLVSSLILPIFKLSRAVH